MSRRTLWGRSAVLALVGSAALLAASPQEEEPAQPTRSSPIAITSDDAYVWSVNPDDDSVSVFKVDTEPAAKVAEIEVGDEPWCVALAPDDRRAYVTNMASGTVSVIDALKWTVLNTIKVGTEPFGCAMRPDGKRLFVTNQSSDTVTVINPNGNRIVEVIKNVGSKPHGIAFSADGKKVYVTQFLALKAAGDTRPQTQSEGADDGREGRVTVISGFAPHRVLGTISLAPIANTGFLSDGNTLAREPLTPAPGPPVFDNITAAFPNLLESIVIRDKTAYVPGTCSSPNGPFRFNVNVQSCLSTIDVDNDVEKFATLNMNVGVPFEPVGTRIFNTNPFAVAFKRSAPEGFVAVGAIDRLLRITVDANGLPTINPPSAPVPAGTPTGIVRIELKDPIEIGLPDPEDRIGGKNPRGLVLNSTDTRAYVMDFTSRDIAIVDISGDPSQYRTLARLQSAGLPDPATVEGIAQRGKQLFNSSIGPEGAADNSKRPAGRMSDFGWGTCYSCHPQALTDTVTWMFPDGPRQAISMESTFELGAAVIENGAPKLPDSHQRALNWSAVRDETQDFTRNIRAVSGGGGLVLDIPEGVAGLGQVPDLVPTANTGRSVDFDAIATYLAIGVRAPISPRKTPFDLRVGRAVFEFQGCQNCHGGKNWTISEIDYTPPPAATEIVDAQLVRFLCRVGTFDPALFADGVSNEIRANNVANVQARGALGFNVPSLISVFASAPYLHSGAAPTLNAVLQNPVHRTAGNPGGFDLLQFGIFRFLLVEFLESIDRSTEPFPKGTPPPGVCGPTP